jgi:hypothetical protein
MGSLVPMVRPATAVAPSFCRRYQPATVPRRRRWQRRDAAGQQSSRHICRYHRAGPVSEGRPADAVPRRSRHSGPTRIWRRDRPGGARGRLTAGDPRGRDHADRRRRARPSRSPHDKQGSDCSRRGTAISCGEHGASAVVPHPPGCRSTDAGEGPDGDRRTWLPARMVVTRRWPRTGVAMGSPLGFSNRPPRGLTRHGPRHTHKTLTDELAAPASLKTNGWAIGTAGAGPP